MNKKDFFDRLFELIHEDPELKAGVLRLMEAQSEAQYQRAEWYKRRNRDD